jgi:hypothetical protein
MKYKEEDLEIGDKLTVIKQNEVCFECFFGFYKGLPSRRTYKIIAMSDPKDYGRLKSLRLLSKTAIIYVEVHEILPYIKTLAKAKKKEMRLLK